MRTLFIGTILLFSTLTCFAQDNSIKTITLTVKGNCKECKKRIENAADIKGVKFSSWDEDKQAITVTYNPGKVTPEQIEKAIAASGHDVANTRANEAKYTKLPACCKYRDKKCESK